jgi:asparagine synthase (glutamine-hydrolysing)
MCGIAGVVGGGADVRRMTARLAHRGPDDEGFHEDVLGFRRLAIIDLAGGAQPMKVCGDLWLVFNGEIYNFRELRARLKDHAFRTRSDAEVILHLYEEKGEAALRELDGMFAFALWDARRRTLFAARDRLGKKPFVYRHDGPSFQFASEIAAIEGPRRMDRAALEAYLAFGVVPAPLTLVEGVRKLPPGHCLTFGDGRLDVRRWWEPPLAAEEADVGEAEWAERVRDALGRAVRKRLVADVPVGAFLSGGVDSSAVAALMPAPVRTFTAGFREAAWDESGWARQVAAHLGTEHREFEVRPDAAAALRTMVERFGEPFGDASCVPTTLLARETAKHVKVVLSGDGGDELFGGYLRYAAIERMARLRRIPAALRAAGAVLLKPWRTNYGERIRRMLELGDAPLGRVYAGLVTTFTPAMRRALGLPGEPVEERVAAPFARHGGAPAAAAAYADLVTYLPDDILVKVDVASMAHGLEVRCPFLDTEVVELSLRIPARLRRGKRVLKKAVEGLLPAAVLERRKQGFGVPLADWLRGELRPMLEDGLRSLGARGWVDAGEVERLRREHQAGAADHRDRLFLLLMLSLWGDTFQPA